MLKISMDRLVIAFCEVSSHDAFSLLKALTSKVKSSK